MNKINIAPVGRLAMYVERYYVIDLSLKTEDTVTHVLPGTGLEMIFPIDDFLLLNNQVYNSANVFCPRKSHRIILTCGSKYLCVRFRIGGFRHFSSCDFSEIHDMFLSLSDIWGSAGRELEEKVRVQTEILAKVRVIEVFLIDCLNMYRETKFVKWDSLIWKFYSECDRLSFSQLAFDSGMSLRTFERHFKKEFGILPKKYQRLCRLEKAVKNISLNNHQKYTESVIPYGYYDNSHFIKEFILLTGMKTKDYFKNRSTGYDYYFKPMKHP